MQQGLRLEAVFGIHGDAHAVETRQRQTVHVQRRAQGGVNIGKALPQSGMRADYQKFVAAKAEHDIRAAQTGQNPLHERQEEAVAHLMPVGIVDILEFIQINIQQGKGLARQTAALDGRMQAAPVAQIGKPIKIHEVFQRALLLRQSEPGPQQRRQHEGSQQGNHHDGGNARPETPPARRHEAQSQRALGQLHLRGNREGNILRRHAVNQRFLTAGVLPVEGKDHFRLVQACNIDIAEKVLQRKDDNGKSPEFLGIPATIDRTPHYEAGVALSELQRAGKSDFPAVAGAQGLFPAFRTFKQIDVAAGMRMRRQAVLHGTARGELQGQHGGVLLQTFRNTLKGYDLSRCVINRQSGQQVGPLHDAVQQILHAVGLFRRQGGYGLALLLVVLLPQKGPEQQSQYPEHQKTAQGNSPYCTFICHCSNTGIPKNTTARTAALHKHCPPTAEAAALPREQ